MQHMSSLAGQLLIATPGLADPNFSRTVIAVAGHDAEGALGVVLNRRAEVSVSDTVPDLADVVESGDRLFLGGPVQDDSIVVMAEFDDPSEAHLVITSDIGLVSERTQIDRLAEIPGRRRAFAGYAGWGPGQLDGEVENEDWFLTEALPEDLFSDDPTALWSDVLDRMGGEYKLVARMPVDVSVN
jgi:putative transcriptional regulator